MTISAADLLYLQQKGEEIIRSTQPDSPIANGDLFQIGSFGYDLYDSEIMWGATDFAANFLPHDVSIYSSPARGTVNLISPLTIQRRNIHRYTCAVILDQTTVKVWNRLGMYDVYEEQITAKVEAFNQLVTNSLIYGIPEQGVSGLLNGSAIPTVIEPLALNLATPDTIVSTLYKQITSTAVKSKFRFNPSRIGMPSELIVLLSSISMSTTNSQSVYSVLEQRLAVPLSNRQKPFVIVSEPAFDESKIMTVLSDNEKDLRGMVFDLVEEEECQHNIASLHVGGVGGVVCRRPESSRIVKLNY